MNDPENRCGKYPHLFNVDYSAKRVWVVSVLRIGEYSFAHTIHNTYLHTTMHDISSDREQVHNFIGQRISL